MFFSPTTRGFYSIKIHGDNMPDDVVEISETVHRDLIAGQSAGGQIESGPDGTPYLVMPPPRSIVEIKMHAKSRVDAAAESARMQFVTRGAGQAWTYQRKETEAEALAADPSPDAADYPFLAACIPADGQTLQEVAATVLAARDAWLSVGATIEGIRRNAKAEVDAADNEGGVTSVLNAIVWPTAPGE